MMLVHSACSGEVFVHGSFLYCDICERELRKEEILVVDGTWRASPRQSKALVARWITR